MSELNMESGDRRSQQPDTATGAVNTGTPGTLWTRDTRHVTMLGSVTLLVTQLVTLARATTGMSLSRSAQSAHANVATCEHMQTAPETLLPHAAPVQCNYIIIYPQLGRCPPRGGRWCSPSPRAASTCPGPRPPWQTRTPSPGKQSQGY